MALGALVLGACSKKEEVPAPAPSASAPASPPVAASKPSAGTPRPPPPAAPNGANNPSGDPMATIFGSLAVELKNRPNVHPSVDDGFAAFAKAGVPIIELEQSLGRTYKAAYCSHGLDTAKQLSVLLCEYPDEEHAAAGGKESEKIFPGLTTRESMYHKTLLLVTIFQEAKHSAATVAAQKKIVAAFKAL